MKVIVGVTDMKGGNDPEAILVTYALSLLKIKSQKLRDWGSESSIDPINPLVYI